MAKIKTRKQYKERCKLVLDDILYKYWIHLKDFNINVSQEEDYYIISTHQGTIKTEAIFYYGKDSLSRFSFSIEFIDNNDIMCSYKIPVYFPGKKSCFVIDKHKKYLQENAQAMFNKGYTISVRSNITSICYFNEMKKEKLDELFNYLNDLFSKLKEAEILDYLKISISDNEYSFTLANPSIPEFYKGILNYDIKKILRRI